MRIFTDYPAMNATVTLEEGDELTEAALKEVIASVVADPVGIWNILLDVSPDVDKEMLHRNGFSIAGTVSVVGTVTMLRWRKSLRRSGDGVLTA